MRKFAILMMFAGALSAADCDVNGVTLVPGCQPPSIYSFGGPFGSRPGRGDDGSKTPEPATLACIGIGMAVVAVRKRIGG